MALSDPRPQMGGAYLYRLAAPPMQVRWQFSYRQGVFAKHLNMKSQESALVSVSPRK
jgi:hypothetical protein